MLASILSKAKALLQNHPEDTDALTELDEMELQRRINQADRRTTEYREQIKSLREEYRSTVERAKRVDDKPLGVVRADLVAVLNRTALARSKFFEALRATHVLQRLALAKRSDTSICRVDFDPDVFPTVIHDPGDLELPHDPDPSTVGFDPVPDLESFEGWGQRGLGDVEARVDDVLTAARSDGPVPTLPELFETDTDDELDEYVHGPGNDDVDEGEADASTRDPSPPPTATRAMTARTSLMRVAVEEYDNTRRVAFPRGILMMWSTVWVCD